MLSGIVLDDERFMEIAGRAKAQIAEIAPLWTDHNDHDPGITFLELFAWMKEMQQFHMDQIGEAHLWSYLRLMGITPLKKKAAEAVIWMNSLTGSVFFPRGSRFFAGEVCFEAVTPVRIGAVEITRLSSGVPEHAERFARREAAAEFSAGGRGQPAWEYDAPVRRESDMHFLAFGSRPQRGSVLRMELSGALKPKMIYCLSIRLSENKELRRNPVGDREGFYPLAELSLRYRGRKGECTARIDTDTTSGLLENGFLHFSLEQEMEQEDGTYELRLVLERCEYDVPPMLAGISLHEQAVVQQRTFVECHDGWTRGGEPVCLETYLALQGEYILFLKDGDIFVPYDGKVEKRIGDEAAFFFLPEWRGQDAEYRIVCYEAGRRGELSIGEGSGLPDQEYRTQWPDLCAEGMLLMMETEKGSGRYLCAERCEDFMEAGASDAVFRYEEERGIIRFGDCDHGIAPEGHIFFAAAHSSLGAGGNVKAESIRRLEGGEQVLAVKNRYPAAGGRDAETVSQSRERLVRAQSGAARAVTNEDYERLVSETPGLMIESARVIPEAADRNHSERLRGTCVTIVVKPCQTEAMAPLSEAYRKNILRALEPKRMIGTRIAVLPPEYIGVSVFAQIVAAGQEQTARRCVEDAAGEFFRKIRASFGVSIRVSAIYGVLDVLDVVAEVTSLTLDAQGKDLRRSKSGDLILPPNGLPYLKDCVLSIASQEEMKL